MSSLHETAYPRLKSEITEKELKETYTPTDAEHFWARSAKTAVARLGLLVHLKLFQRLGYFQSLDAVPREIIEHVGGQCQFRKLPTQTQLLKYDRSGAKHRHQKLIRAHLGVKPAADADSNWLYEVAVRAAETKETLSDIVNVMLEELVRHRFELPGFTVLKRTARRARSQVNERCFSAITTQLATEAKQKVDELLSPDGQTYSAWHILKREPKRPGNKEVRSYLQHVHWLQALGEEMPAIELPVVKHRQFALEARALNATEMADLKPNKRYALAVILIRSQHSKALDDVAELLIRMVRSMESHAQTALQQYLLDHQKHIDRLIETFKDVLTAYEQDTSQQQRLASIEGVIGENSGALIDRCNEHMAYAGNNYFPFMLAPYRQKRALLFNCLSILELKSTSNDTTSNALLSLFRSLQSSRSEYVKMEAAGDIVGGAFDPNWMPEKWRKLVLVKSEPSGEFNLLHRKYLELWILIHIKQELSSGDLHIPHSAQFDDYREQLIDDETLDEELEEYGQQVELPLSDPKAFCAHLKDLLTERSRQVDERFPKTCTQTSRMGGWCCAGSRPNFPPKSCRSWTS